MSREPYMSGRAKPGNLMFILTDTCVERFARFFSQLFRQELFPSEFYMMLSSESYTITVVMPNHITLFAVVLTDLDVERFIRFFNSDLDWYFFQRILHDLFCGFYMMINIASCSFHVAPTPAPR